MERQEQEQEQEYVLQSTLVALVDAALAIEKVRVRSQVRQTHLNNNNREDTETDNLVVKLKELEEYVDNRVAKHITTHPAYPWFSRVKGVGKENIGKVVALCDINKAPTISALWKFTGFAVEDGKAPKRQKGEKLSYNSQLRSMCWRLAGSLLRAGGQFYEYYLEQKQHYCERYEAQGIKIVPAEKLPKVNGKKIEGNGYISEGHIHNMALRKMIKLFLACLWLTWREAEGLELTKPYAIEILNHHHYINPWGMVDR